MRLDIQLFADGKVVIETELDTSGFEDGLDDMENGSRISQFINNMKDKFSAVGKAMSDGIAKAGTGIKGLAKKIAVVGSVAIKTMAKVLVSAVSFGLALTAALGIVALLGLAFLAIVEAAKKVGEENKTIKNDIQYIVFALTTALQPVIDWIANALVKIIQFLITIFKYAMAIVNTLAGRNLFAKATPEAFAKKMKESEKSSKGVAKNAKEIRKQLAGFDEMNVLTDNSGGGAGGGGAAMPDYSTSFDLSNLGDIQEKVDKIVGTIKKGWDDILKINMDDLVKMVASTDRVWGTLKAGWAVLIQGIVFIFQGFIDIVSGILGLLVGIFTLNWEMIKVSLKKIWDGIVEVFRGVIEVIIGLFLMIIGVIQGVFTTIVDIFKKLFNWINEKFIQPAIEKFNNFKDKVVGVWNNIKSKATEIFTNIKTFITDKIITPITSKFNTFKSTITGIFNGIKDALKGPLNTMIGWVNKLIDGLNKVSIKVPAWVNEMLGKGYKESKWGFNISKIPKLAKGGIINMPGRGTLVGGAIAGEVGREAVLPLTDSQQMELLGEAIGRYITINANITNSMNGRIISRELQKIQNENTFAMNR